MACPQKESISEPGIEFNDPSPNPVLTFLDRAAACEIPTPGGSSPKSSFLSNTLTWLLEFPVEVNSQLLGESKEGLARK